MADGPSPHTTAEERHCALDYGACTTGDLGGGGREQIEQVASHAGSTKGSVDQRPVRSWHVAVILNDSIELLTSDPEPQLSEIDPGSRLRRPNAHQPTAKLSTPHFAFRSEIFRTSCRIRVSERCRRRQKKIKIEHVHPITPPLTGTAKATRRRNRSTIPF
jgi:hypothetical protein